MLSVDDRAAIIAEVERFGVRTLAPLMQYSEHPPDHAELGAALMLAAEMGILPHTREPGFALWELANEAAGFQLHLEVLTNLARHNAALTLEMHLRALAQHILRSSSVEYTGTVSVVLDAHGGLARYSLARYLAKANLNDEDRLILKQYFVATSFPSTPFYFETLEAVQLLVPVWQKDDRLEWHLYATESLIMESVACHGLDEIDHYEAMLKPAVIPVAVFAADSTGPVHYADVLAMHSSALLAIQVGVAAAAYARAKEYAAARSQGGCLIQEHPAVQQLLINSRAGARLGQALLATLPLPQSVDALCDIMEKRAALQEQLYSSVTDALQVFGGYGYMQDYGIEKLLRDQNQLAQLGGTAANTRLFLATLENLNTMQEAM